MNPGNGGIPGGIPGIGGGPVGVGFGVAGGATVVGGNGGGAPDGGRTVVGTCGGIGGGREPGILGGGIPIFGGGIFGGIPGGANTDAGGGMEGGAIVGGANDPIFGSSETIIADSLLTIYAFLFISTLPLLPKTWPYSVFPPYVTFLEAFCVEDEFVFDDFRLSAELFLKFIAACFRLLSSIN